MRVNYLKLIIVIFFILLTTTGCWDSHDIEHDNIVTSVVVDKTDTGYVVFAELASTIQSNNNQNGQQEGSSTKSFILKAEGKNFEELRMNFDVKSNNPIFLGSDQCVIITQRMAESGIEEYVNRIKQLPEYRKTLHIVTTSENPEKLLKSKTGNKDLVGFAIEDTIQSLVDQGKCVHFTLADLYEIISSPNKCYYMPSIGLINDDITLVGYSIFYGGYYKGFIPIDESKGFILMRAKKPKESFSIIFEDNNYNIEARMTKKNISVKYKDGQIYFNLSYECNALLMYMKKNINVTDELKQAVNDELKKTIKNDILKTVEMSQKTIGYDYLNLYNNFRINYPEEAKNIDWIKQYPNVQINIDVITKLDITSNIDYGPK